MADSIGRFIWHELMTTDVEGAVAFYSSVFGWKTQRFDESEYLMWTNNGTPMGAVIPAESGHASNGRPHWLPSVCVYDVDGCAREVKAQGGHVMYGPNEMPAVGTWAVIADPEGVEIGLYEPEGPESPQSTGHGNGIFSWHELGTSNYKNEFTFYSKIFHWQMVHEADMGPQGVYAMFGPGGSGPFGGLYNKTSSMPGGAWLSYVQVPDAATAVADVKSAGGTVTFGPHEVPGGHVAVCADPQDIPFAIHAPRASTA